MSLRRYAIACYLFLVILWPHYNVIAQNDTAAYEVNISLRLPKVGNHYVDALFKGDHVYVPLLEVFQFTKLQIKASDSKIEGFVFDDNQSFELDLKSIILSKNGEKYTLQADEYYLNERGFFLRTDKYLPLFGFDCRFNIRDVQAVLIATREFPAVTEARNRLRPKQNFRKRGQLAGYLDKEIPIVRPLFSLGILDWTAQSEHTRTDKIISGNGRLGGSILFGDAIGIFKLSSADSQLSLRSVATNTSWRWRYGFPEEPLISQVSIGSMSLLSQLGSADSILGVQITNRSARSREEFSTYVIIERTEPDWIVELFINDVMTDQVIADHEGYFRLEIPLIYGSTDVRLRYYGPEGRTSLKEISIIVPYTFLPPGEVEYTIAGGTGLSDFNHLERAIGEARLNVGISQWMTLSGSTLFNAAASRQYIPQGALSLAPYGSIIMSAEYTHGQGLRNTMNWSSDRTTFDASYYHPIPFADNRSANGDNARISLTTELPLLGNATLTLSDQQLGEDQGASSAGLHLYSSLFTIPFNLQLSSIFDRAQTDLKLIAANASTGFTLPILGLQFRPSVSIDLMTRNLTQVSTSVRIPITRTSSIGVRGDYQLETKQGAASLNYSFRLPFASMGVSGQTSNRASSGVIAASGSVVFDHSTADLMFSNLALTERAGVIITPFLDGNSDGVRSDDEEIVKGFWVSSSDGTVIVESDGSLRVIGLEPYIHQTMKLSMRNVENIALVPEYKTFGVTVSPNKFTLVEIPVTVGGQLSGSVAVSSTALPDVNPSSARPAGGVRILIRQQGTDSTLVSLDHEILTYSSGEFYYLGLRPGKYEAFVDPEQLAIKKVIASPAIRQFEIKNINEGDLVEQLNFVISPVTE